MQLFTITESDAGERMDLFLTRKLPEYSRSQVQRFIHEGMVLVNGTVAKSQYKLHLHDTVKISPTEFRARQRILPEDIPLEIIFEDDQIVLINKPAGMIVHPAGRIYSGTLVNALLHHWQGFAALADPVRPGLVHRLDKDTSGIMVVAKTDQARSFIAQQFADRTVVRRYVAIVYGVIEIDEGLIDCPIGRHVRDRKKMSTSALTITSKEAQTYYKVLRRAEGFTVLEIKPITGRTHQIRVHMDHIGHPLLGDIHYGNSRIAPGAVTMSRQALHAVSLEFVHPVSKETVYFECALPDDMQTFFALEN